MKKLVRVAWVAVIVGLVSFGMSFQATPRAATDLVGRFWMDHMPRSTHEAIKVVVFTAHRRGSQLVGVVETGESQFKWHSEFFTYQAGDQEINYRFPHDRSEAASQYRVEPIKNDEGFNMKLTLLQDPRNNNNQSVYYTNTRWDRGADQVPAFLPDSLQLEP